MDAARVYFCWRPRGGGLIVGVALRRGDRRDQVADLVAEEGDTLLSMWVKIDEAGKITAIVPHSEMGQGAQTVLTQMLADEMDANWADVSLSKRLPKTNTPTVLLARDTCWLALRYLPL